MRNRYAVALVVGLLSFTLVAEGCGSKSSSSASSPAAGGSSSGGQTTIRLPTAKFALHAGLAFGAFHRYIYKPLKAGTFSGGLFHHKLALVKAGLAGLFAYHEVKLAIADARASPLLRRLVTPFTALAATLGALASRLRGGHVDAAAVQSANNGIAGASSAAAQSGTSIGDKIPSAGQLASG